MRIISCSIPPLGDDESMFSIITGEDLSEFDAVGKNTFKMLMFRLLLLLFIYLLPIKIFLQLLNSSFLSIFGRRHTLETSKAEPRAICYDSDSYFTVIRKCWKIIYRNVQLFRLAYSFAHDFGVKRNPSSSKRWIDMIGSTILAKRGLSSWSISYVTAYLMPLSLVWYLVLVTFSYS